MIAQEVVAALDKKKFAEVTAIAPGFINIKICPYYLTLYLQDMVNAEKYGYEPVNVVPQPKAGGSFATATYKALAQPVAVEHIKAHLGMDIGDTLIGMHLKDVAVPVRIPTKQIGEAHLVCARTRAKFIGGERAVYNKELL